MKMELNDWVKEKERKKLNKEFKSEIKKMNKELERGELSIERFEIRLLGFWVSNPNIKKITGFESLQQ